MKIKLLGGVICLGCFLSIYLFTGKTYDQPIKYRVAPQPTSLQSYILPYDKQAIFRFTQPAPRRDFIWTDEDIPESSDSDLMLIDSVIVIPNPIHS